MGIPSYFSNIIKSYPEIIKTIKNLQTVDYLFMDCNSIIYDCFHNLDKSNIKYYELEKLLIKAIISKLNKYMAEIGGSTCQLFFLAFDGVAPVAKMEQQKTRRYKSKYEKEYFNKDDENSWDTCAITPGTVFMNVLERALVNEYRKNKKIKVEFSNRGEGEHKIFDYIRQQSFLKGNTVIYGLDSDLIMLSLQNKHFCEEIFLYREMPEFIQSIDKSFKPNEMYMVDVSLFKEKLELYMNNMNCKKSIDRIKDYIFICFLLGNDFLPHFPALNLRRNGMDYLMDTYIHVVGESNNKIIDDGEINWKIFRKLIIELSNNEENYIVEENNYRNKLGRRHFPNNTQEEKEIYFLNQPIINRTKEKYINPEDEFWKNRYYYMLFDIDLDKLTQEEYDNKIKDICINYLEGLEWTFKYYSNGCVNWKWKYNYHYPPLLQDLKKYVPYFKETLVQENKDNSVNEIVQLCYVLPNDNKLYEKILYTKNKQDIQRFNKIFENIGKPYFESSYCRYFWESHVCFPNTVPISTIETFYKNV